MEGHGGSRITSFSLLAPPSHPILIGFGAVDSIRGPLDIRIALSYILSRHSLTLCSLTGSPTHKIKAYFIALQDYMPLLSHF